MASPNPYAMDPNLMLGFSNLSKALLGSAQDDASTARANLYDAQTETEKALLDPRVQSERALAYQRTSAGKNSLAGAMKLNEEKLTEIARRQPEVDLLIAQKLKETAAAGSFDAQAEERIAAALLNNAKTETETATLQPTINKINSETGAFEALGDQRIAAPLLNNAKTQTETATLQPTINKINSETGANNALAEQRRRPTTASLSSRNVNYGDTITEEQVSDLLPEAENRIVAAYEDSVPDSVKFGIRDRIIRETDKNLANGQDFQTAQSNAFNKLLPMTSVNTSTFGTDAVIPTVTHNLFLGSANIAKQGKTKNGNPYSSENHVAAMTRELKNLGYESAVISKIIKQYPVSKN